MGSVVSGSLTSRALGGGTDQIRDHFESGILVVVLPESRLTRTRSAHDLTARPYRVKRISPRYVLLMRVVNGNAKPFMIL